MTVFFCVPFLLPIRSAVLLFALNYNLGATIYFRSLAFLPRSDERQRIFESFDDEAEVVRALLLRFLAFYPRPRSLERDTPRLATRLINDFRRVKSPGFLPRSLPSCREFPISISRRRNFSLHSRFTVPLFTPELIFQFVILHHRSHLFNVHILRLHDN